MKFLHSKAYADSKYDAVKLAIFFLLIQNPVEQLRGVAINLTERDEEYLATAIAFSPGLLVKKEGVPGDDLELHPMTIRYSIEQMGIVFTIDKLMNLWSSKYG